jgi:hypothetical protein
MDETWLIHYTSDESNRQSVERTERDESNPKRGKTQRSAGKVMASDFWDARGIILIDYLEKGPGHKQRVLHSVIGAFKPKKSRKNGPI